MNDDPEELLRATYKLAKENNKLLHRLRRDAIIGRILYFLWIAFLIGAPIALYYYFLQPVIQQFFDASAGVREVGSQAPERLRNVLENIGIQLGGE